MRLKPYNTLLTIARQVKLFITPARQTFAELPQGAVPVWSEDFFGWCLNKFQNEPFPAPITYNRVLRQLDEDAKAQSRNTVRPANLRTAFTNGGYTIDLGGPVVHITGKQWKILPPDTDENRNVVFMRPIPSRPLPAPTHSEKKLKDHLSEAFAINEESASKLGQWLELALRPGQPCPTLVLTGELRDEAAEAIRQLIDPCSCPLFPFPGSRGEATWMALYNRVLAFPLYGTMSEFKRNLLRAFANGSFAARLRQADRKLAALTDFLKRPIILTAESAPEICHNQIAIEIKRCANLRQSEVLAALFDQMVESLHNENAVPGPIPYKECCYTQHSTVAQPDAPIP